MVQAARSGVRNISEGSGAAATSRKSEMLLTNVARASLSDELLKDYESFLTQRGLRVWAKNSREALAMRERLTHDSAPNLPPEKKGRTRLTIPTKSEVFHDGRIGFFEKSLSPIRCDGFTLFELNLYRFSVRYFPT